MRRQAHSFFYASRFLMYGLTILKMVSPLPLMVGGVLGGREACRILDPVCKPDMSSTAICFAALVGGFKPLSRSQS